MQHAWSLRDEILMRSHRWPVIIASILIGSLLGAAVSLLWVSPYRATTDLYVALNVYGWSDDSNASAFADYFVFNYPDDYKNWQMADLNTVILGNEVLQDTLTRLQAEDSYWQSVSLEGLQGMLDVYWRNAGRWRLVATHPEPEHAQQMTLAWQEAILERVPPAIGASKQVMLLDSRRKALDLAYTETLSETVRLDQAHAQLQAWQAEEMPALAADQPLTPEERRRALAPLFAVEGESEFQNLLNHFPDPAGQAEVSIWVEDALFALNARLVGLEAQAAALNEERAALAVQITAAAERSYGFSPLLEVSRLEEDTLEVSRERPTSLLALVGAALGLLAWILEWAYQITRKMGRE